jgi:hypothetical protein
VGGELFHATTLPPKSPVHLLVQVWTGTHAVFFAANNQFFVLCVRIVNVRSDLAVDLFLGKREPTSGAEVTVPHQKLALPSWTRRRRDTNDVLGWRTKGDHKKFGPRCPGTKRDLRKNPVIRVGAGVWANTTRQEEWQQQ